MPDFGRNHEMNALAYNLARAAQTQLRKKHGSRVGDRYTPAEISEVLAEFAQKTKTGVQFDEVKSAIRSMLLEARIVANFYDERTENNNTAQYAQRRNGAEIISGATHGPRTSNQAKLDAIFEEIESRYAEFVRLREEMNQLEIRYVIYDHKTHGHNKRR